MMFTCEGFELRLNGPNIVEWWLLVRDVPPSSRAKRSRVCNFEWLQASNLVCQFHLLLNMAEHLLYHLHLMGLAPLHPGNPIQGETEALKQSSHVQF